MSPARWRCEGRGVFFLARRLTQNYPADMSTLAEIETAVNSLPRHEQEVLYAHLRDRLEAGPARHRDRLEALSELQKSLALDAGKVRAWQAAVREARR